MRLFYWQAGDGPNNFGDALNPWLWPRELGALLDGTAGPWLVGIGSLLGSVRPFPSEGLRLVLGAGAGYGAPPRLDADWRVYAVRGPRTAAVLDLPPETAASDPAILVRRHFARDPTLPRAGVALMLHWRSANTAWRGMAEELGWAFVDPRAEVEEVLRTIAGAELLVTEALHGAIVADAFRVPWIPIRSSREILAFKWEDWCGSVGLEYRPVSVRQLYDGPAAPGAARAARAAVKRLLVRRTLREVAGQRPFLSTAAQLDSAEQRLDYALDRLREDAARGEFRGLSRLHGTSAGGRE